MKFLPQLSTTGLVLLGITATSNAAQLDSLAKPDDNRFSIVRVTQPDTLNEPMAFEIADDGRAFIIERRGGIKVFDPATQSVKPVGMLAVNNAARVGNGEQGLVGLTLDPKFADNGWIYLYYQLPDEAKSRLSRWQIRNDVLVANSEKVMLEWPAQREACCHTGGGMTWDKDGNLFLTVGNNRGNNQTSHTDERPGRAPWDDQGGAANSNSLEGKILRIHPEPDGSYSIPKGNLFPPGTPDTRPEIYTMGHRNAWRVSLDSQTGYLYWGEVGPDVRQTSERAPLGYDEFNQARGPGFFGWPYFVGDNAYPVWDYVNNTGRPALDPKHPVNHSPNNTGIKELPPLSPSFIYYPYGVSEQYPELGSGGRSATGGPVYRRADFPNAKRPWPAYFEGKWLAAELSRRMIAVIAIDQDGNPAGLERFLPHYKPVEPIDMKFGPSGDLYVLEYGGRWYQASPEAKLTRIEFEAGNRKPIVVASADKIGGIPPFQVQYSSAGTEDYDRDQLTYRWDIVDIGGNKQTFNEPNPKVTLDGPGTYVARLTVSDPSGASDSQSVAVVSGNEPPKVAVDVAGNESFFFPDQPFGYRVSIEDREDGSLRDGRIAPERVAFSINYATADFDVATLASLPAGDEMAAKFPVAQALLTKGNCKSCHLPDVKLVGPSFADIAAKYRDDAEAPAKLAQKIITGGAGAWGEVAMPPNATINEAEAGTILKYILSLGGSTDDKLALAGEYLAAIPSGDDGTGKLILRASYLDNGEEIAPPLPGQSIKVLRSPTLAVTAADDRKGVVPGRTGATVSASGYVAFRQLDLTGIKQLEVAASASTFGGQKGGDIEVRLGSPTGALIGKATIAVQQPNFGGGANAARRAGRGRFVAPPTPIAIEQLTGAHDVYLVFQNPGAAEGDTLMSVSSVKFSNVMTPATAQP